MTVRMGVEATGAMAGVPVLVLVLVLALAGGALGRWCWTRTANPTGSWRATVATSSSAFTAPYTT